MADDPKLSKADRGWLKQEKNAVDAGKRTNMRNPPGKDLAHAKGKEAAKGYSYKHSKLQDKDLHRRQHKHDNNGRNNKENLINMKITDKEIESVSQLEPIKRYQYFIKRVADTEKMYTLVDTEGDWAIADVERKAVFSLWSAPEFANQCLIGEWEDCSVKEISMEDFEDEVIDQIEEEKYLLNIFSVNSKSGFIVDINEFARDLSDEMKNY